MNPSTALYQEKLHFGLDAPEEQMQNQSRNRSVCTAPVTLRHHLKPSR